MTDGEYLKIKNQIEVLRELQERYGGKTLDNVLVGLEMRIKEADKNVSRDYIEELMKNVCEVFHITKGQLTSKSRELSLVKARSVFAVELYAKGWKQGDIADILCHNRTTIGHLLKIYQRDFDYDKDLRDKACLILSRMKA